MKRLLIFAALFIALEAASFAFLPNTYYLNLPSHKTHTGSEITITHRFYGAAGKDDFLGMDAGANVLLGFSQGFGDNFNLSILRSSFCKEYFLSGKWMLVNSSNVGIAFLLDGSSRGTAYLNGSKSGFVSQLVLTKKNLEETLRISIVPSIYIATDLSGNTVQNNTTAIGLIGAYGIKDEVGYLREIEFIGEYIPMAGGYELQYPTQSIGIKFRTFGHYFTLMLTNSTGTLPTTYLPGSSQQDYHFGFNITRDFLNVI